MIFKTTASKTTNHKGFLFDLVIYITVMFLIREVSIPNVSFLVTGLFWSFTTLIVASWRMKVRGVTWKELGLTKPKNLIKTLLIAGLILVTTVICLLIFNILKDQLPFFTEQIPVLATIWLFQKCLAHSFQIYKYRILL